MVDGHWPRLEVDQYVAARGFRILPRIGEHLVRSIDAKDEFQATHIDFRSFFDRGHHERRAPGFCRQPLEDKGGQSRAFPLPIGVWPVSARQGEIDHRSDLRFIGLDEILPCGVATTQFGEHAMHEGSAFALRRKPIPWRAFAQVEAVPRPCAKRAQRLVPEHGGAAGLRLARD